VLEASRAVIRRGAAAARRSPDIALDGRNYATVYAVLGRHTKDFFEWCVWIGYAVYGLAFWPWGLIALGGQAITLGSIFEAQAIRSKGDAYRAYQRRVSRFVPRPPKRDA
jgi:steroid 5-alpha reductase family enzyme